MSQLLLLNPRRRRKLTAKQRKYFGKRKRARRVSVKVRHPRRSRRTAVITVKANPRRRSRRLSINPRRRSIHRNPSPRLSVRSITDQVQTAAVGAVGATVVDVAMGYVGPMLPAALVGPNIYPVVKGAAAVLLGAAGQMAGLGKWSGQMAQGSLTVTLHGVIRSFLPAGVALGYVNSGYVPRQGMGAYTMKGVRTPLMGVRTPLMGMGEGAPGWTSQMESENALYGPGYVAGGMRGLGAYMNGGR